MHPLRRSLLALCTLALLAPFPGPARAAAVAGEATARMEQGPQGPRIYAYYYLFWNADHWHDKLGPNYPYGRDNLPLPATLEPGGCGAKSKYRDNELFDVPAHRLWSQDNPALIEKDVRLAAEAGLAGFLANWH